MADLLTPAQRAAAERVIADEALRREHLVVYLSGAHAYGFPSPDSDVDLKAIHVTPASALLGLVPPATSADRMEVVDGVEIDYTSNELAGVLLGILQGNGNYLERVLGESVVSASPLLEELRPLVRGTLSKRFYRHYRGFATNQLRSLEAQPTVKRALYVLRTTLTGVHLLRTGELVTDVTRLLEPHGFVAARVLVRAKLAGERVALAGDALERWRRELDRAFAALDAAHDDACLPSEPVGARALEAWLVTVRRASLG